MGAEIVAGVVGSVALASTLRIGVSRRRFGAAGVGPSDLPDHGESSGK